MKSVNTKILIIWGVLAAVSCQVLAREFRSPLPMIRGERICQPEHYKEDDSWYVQGWAGAYARNADRAYVNGTNTEPLSVILFGQECFRIVDTFANQGAGQSFASNPFAKISWLRPDFAYQENGIVIGLQAEGKLSNRWSLGFRTAVPFRNIWGIPTPCSYGSCCCAGADVTINDVVLNDIESHLGASFADAYAYRLDFLAALTNVDWPPALVSPFILFDAPIRTTLSDAQLGAASATPGVTPAPGVHVLRSLPGESPALPFGATSTDVLASPVVSADGSIPGAPGQRGRFDTTTDYSPLGNSPGTMSQLWVVPTFGSDGADISDEAKVLRGQVERRIGDIEFASALDFLTSRGICFSQTVNTGVGDWDMQLFAGYDAYDWWRMNFLLGVRWPTDNQVSNPNALLKFPTGNNGHYELLIGMENYATFFDWLGAHLHFDFDYVFPRTEPINAAFQGACIKNIGPCTTAKVHWYYFNLEFGLTFFHPRNNDLGLDITYDFYAKSRDHIKFCQQQVADFNGICNCTSNCVAEEVTNQLAHTIRGAVFYQYKQYYLLGGASHVFAGRNMPRESDVYLMFKMTF